MVAGMAIYRPNRAPQIDEVACAENDRSFGEGSAFGTFRAPTNRTLALDETPHPAPRRLTSPQGEVENQARAEEQFGRSSCVSWRTLPKANHGFI
jgi:hypothetical protein